MKWFVMENSTRTVSRGRSGGSKRHRQFRPWKPAHKLDHCFLYWLPVKNFPLPGGQRTWALEFLNRWDELVKSQYNLFPEQFLALQAIHPQLLEAFGASSREFKPLQGKAWRPGVAPPSITEQDVKALQEGDKLFDFKEYSHDQCYWFLNKAAGKQRDLFFGHAGMLVLYMEPEPRMQLPPFPVSAQQLRASPVFGVLFKDFDIEQVRAEAFALQSSFLSRSKELFQASVAPEASVKEALFVVPSFASADFFSKPPEEIRRWLNLFPMYLTESRPDNGILLASKHNLEDLLISIIEGMTRDGLSYQEEP